MDAFVAAFPVLAVQGCEVSALIGSNYADTETTGAATALFPTGETADGSDSADTTAALLDVEVGLPSYGEWWCVRAEGAVSDDDPILYDDATPPEGCQCVAYNTEVHAWILDHEVDDEVGIEQVAIEMELGVGDPLVDALLELRQQIYLDAGEECILIAPPLPPNNCMDPGLFDLDPLTTELEPRPIYRGDREGNLECTPDPQGIIPPCAFVSQGSRIRLVSGAYQVPKALLDGFVEEPTCLMHQGWRVGLNSLGFVLRGISTNDILYRLGLRTNDHFVAITAAGDRISLEDAEGAILALGAFASETSFSLEMRRGTTLRTFQYRVIP